MGHIINASVVDLKAEGGEFYIDAEADDTDIVYRPAIIASGLDWVSFVRVEHEAGAVTGRYVFNAAANETGAPRSADIGLVYLERLDGPSHSYGFTAEQPSPAAAVESYELSLSPTPTAFDATGGNGTYTSLGTTIYSDGSRETVEVNERVGVGCSWIRVDNDNKTFVVDPNTTAADRSCVLSQIWNGVTATATITQAAGEATYSDPVITVSYEQAPATGGIVSPTGRVAQVKTNPDGTKQYINVALLDLQNAVYAVVGDDATIDAATGALTWSENESSVARTVQVSVSGTLNGKRGDATVDATQEAGVTYTYSTPDIALSYPTKDGSGGNVSPAGRAIQIKTGSDGSVTRLFLSLSAAESTKYTISGEGASIDANSGVITWTANSTHKVRKASVTIVAVFNGKQGTATAEAEQLMQEYYDAPTFAISYEKMAADGGTGEVPTVTATQVYHHADGTSETLTGVAITNKSFSAASSYIKSIEEKSGRLRWLKNKSYQERTVTVQFAGECHGISATTTATATQLAQEQIYLWPLWFDHFINVDVGVTGEAVSYQLGYVDRKGIFDVPPSYSGRIITGDYGIGRINATEIIRHILPSGPAWMQEWIYTDNMGTSERFYVCSDFSYSPADPFVGALMYDIPPFFMTDQLQTKIWRDARFYIGAWGSAAVTQYDEAGNILRYRNYEDTYLNYVEIHPDAARMVVACGGEEQVYCCIDKPSNKPAYVLNFGNRYGAAQSLCVWGNVVKSDSDIARTTFRNGSRFWDKKGEVPRQERVLNVKYSPRWTLNTGFLYNVPDQLMDIFVTMEAELYDMQTGNIIPVIVEGASAEYQTYRNQGNRPVNFTITVKQAATQITYR